MYSMNSQLFACVLLMGGFIHAQTVKPSIPSRNIPVFRPDNIKNGEKSVVTLCETNRVESNGLFDKVRVTVTFTNPNPRDFSGDLELQLPCNATVCGYALEIDGRMEPGVVTLKEQARVAFESEKAKRVDPGLVEHVAANIWRTRIFPLRCNLPRKAQVDYIVPNGQSGVTVVCERDGEDYFLGERVAAADSEKNVLDEKIAGFDNGAIVWDVSGSAGANAARWRTRLAKLPSAGNWNLVLLANLPQHANVGVRIKSRDELLRLVDSLDYDGGTDVASAIDFAKKLLGDGEKILLFSDEVDTLGIDAPQYEDDPAVVIAGREDGEKLPVRVKKIDKSHPAAKDAKDGMLLATAWAAERIRGLSSQAAQRKDEFLQLGRRYGVASPVTSIIVLETLEQWLTHKIEPPKGNRFRKQWLEQRAAEDDAIALRKAKAEHEKDLLVLWEERVKWWKNPIPPKKTPSSGLFDSVPSGGNNVRRMASSSVRAGMLAPSGGNNVRRMASVESSFDSGVAHADLAESEVMAFSEGVMPGESKSAGSGAAPTATIAIAKWDPDSPYLKTLNAAASNKVDVVAEYMVLRRKHAASPAFFMDVADWFFKRGDSKTAKRILSNMAEFALDNPAIWRSMGWRLREAGEYDEAIRCMRKVLVLRGEEGQSRRDLAILLAERGKARRSPDDLSEAMVLLKEAAFTVWARRSGVRSNDRQVAIVALEELNALISYVNQVSWPDGKKPAIPELDPVFRRDLPVKVRIVMSWSADETDIDLHVLEPEGEEAFYRNRRTSSGGFVGEDVVTGYGPEEYLRKEGKGLFKIMCNYFASWQTGLTGATMVSVTVYTDWGTKDEQMKMLTIRLDKPKDRYAVGEIDIR